jgi:16S rRNA (adenine1518-N6/adenine1519-N6)-dimethyltransferase
MKESAKERLTRVLQQTESVAKRSLGQNFLVSDAVIGSIIAAVQKMKPISLIEDGPHRTACGIERH